MLPTEVLAAQGDLLERLQGVPGFQRYIKAYSTAEMGENGDDRFLEQSQEAMLRTLTRAAKLADSYLVTSDMSALVQQMADSLDGTDRFTKDFLPSPWGFVRFDSPIGVMDARGRKMLAHFLLWGPASTNAGPATVLMWSNDSWTTPDEINGLMREQYESKWPEKSREELDKAWEEIEYYMGRWAFVGLDLAFQDQRLGPPRQSPSERQALAIMEEGEEPHLGTNLTRVVWALCLMLGQTITRTSDGELNRAALKRAKRRGIPQKVTVIDLRRVVDPNRPRSEGGNVEWGYQWWSKDHFGWRHCGENHPLAQPYEKGWRCRVHIRGSWKGNPEGPIVITDKVRRLRR